MMALLTIARQYSANFHLLQEPCATCRIPGALLNDLSHMWPLKSTQASDEIIREAVQQMRNPLTRALGTSSLSNFSLHPVPVRVVSFFLPEKQTASCEKQLPTVPQNGFAAHKYFCLHRSVYPDDSHTFSGGTQP